MDFEIEIGLKLIPNGLEEHSNPAFCYLSPIF
jgi:hypothetical protein